ncbi:Membrane carboxypeptidase (penicillin-binding protein) [Rubrobacter radiotolerans]|uniref:Membrane carboxypeptidase (Penicillin-binding protein) n=1 Tax=Rubrobacter radiotolerans TaxID=42256 RepID=A0A023X2D2_RUBRA|nr:transglycosylase domain-containing protein [Rubrobacter radiotolerans]AHY46381.1 Membrane carboxypeptidase (penicillin-binding protein) [Rubrobacter radiotolerans]MDX5893788.1 transglycosylase domain-containing protein [Rubrobacter radiotolerans]SMC04506.1 penicillin-binding protein 1A [Rubrobacter radiotolerans DSM 5868]
MTSAFHTRKDPFATRRKRGGPRRAPSRRGSFLGKTGRFFRGVFNLALILCVLALAVLGGSYLYIVQTHRAGLSERYPDLIENSYVYDRNGETIAEIRGAENRVTVGREGLGEYLPLAVVAIEDRRFADHVGVDFEGLARAAWTDLRAGRVEEGGSTITEQLMKNLFVPEEERYRTSFARRFMQASLAFDYERGHSKEEILTGYLNTVYFGAGSYGAQTAAQAYFGKSASELDLSEAATLAGFLHAPSTYADPNAPEPSALRRAELRRDEVLRAMREEGLVTEREYLRARGTPLAFSPAPPPEFPDYGTFLDGVLREARAELGEETVERGGLSITTTLDAEMQAAAEESVPEVLYEPDDPSAAVVSVEPQSGAVRAVVGRDGSFNLALDARRQPGSAFKPFVLAEALRRNISPESLYLSREVDFGEGEYKINNYDLSERGAMSLTEALAESDNTVFVRLGMYLGMDRVVRMARSLGIESPLSTAPATVIGGSTTAVSPLEMASSYATFAAGGVHREPYFVERVELLEFGERSTVHDHAPSGRRVLGGDEAAAATLALREVVTEGTASRFHDLDRELGRQSAGKTGTTDAYVDAWYVGYTPTLSTAVWVGYPDGNRSMAGVHGLQEAGGETLPLDLWAEYMSRVTAGEPGLEFSEPDLARFLFRDESDYDVVDAGSGY